MIGNTHTHALLVVRAQLTAVLAAMPPEETPQRVLEDLADAHSILSDALATLARLDLEETPA